MWTSTLELSPGRVILTQVLGRVWHGAYFSSFAPLQVQNLPRQTLPASNWVRVRNRLAGICGSDLPLVYVDRSFRIAPAALPSNRYSYPGHEVVGEVIEVGNDVEYLQVGDRVVLQSGPNCLSTGAQTLCHACAAGNYNLCERVSQLSGPQPIGGGWSEEMLLHEQQLFRVPSAMSDEQAVLLEPSAVALHAVLRRLPQPGEQVLIIGAGTIGLLTLQVIRALAPQATVSMMARYAFQIEQATRMDAAHILYPQDSYKSVARTTGAQLYSGMFGNKMLLGGFDVIYDTIGSRQTVFDSLRWTRAGGTVVVVGLSLHTMPMDLTPIWYQEINLTGTYGHGTENWPIGTQERYSTFAIAAALIENQQLHPEKLITHRFALSDYRAAFSTATSKSRSRAIKIVFDYALLPASVVPNVRASARQRRSIRTVAAWPQQEEQHDQEESSWPTPPEEQFIPPSLPATPEPMVVPTPDSQSEPTEAEPIIVPAPDAQSELDVTQPVIVPSPDAQSELVEVEATQSTVPPDEEQPDESQTITKPVSRPKRPPRQSMKSHKTTEDVEITEDAQKPGETSGNSIN
jgi:2-desacetyl-2-hydroxyethyl bacteriochlorophyllide A dehydrogenase